VRNTNRMPRAIPNAHTTAMAESRRTRRLDSQSAPRELPAAKMAAAAAGETPRK
jgi:hypothetical protein